MKNSILSLVMMLLLGVLPSSAQKFTKAYVDEPMPNVLRDIDEVYAEGNINFIFLTSSILPLKLPITFS